MALKVKQRLIQYLLSRKEEEGFTLVELIVVMAIMSFLAQLGVVSYQNSARRAVAVGANVIMRNIKTECEMHRDLKMNEIFTLLTPDRYSIQTRDTNSCLGNSDSGLVSLVPENQDKYPSYFYNHITGEISCNYKNISDNMFKECQSRKDILEANNFVVKNTFSKRGCSDYVWVNGPSWSQAQANAVKLGGNLATINDKEENDFLMEKFKNEATNHMKADRYGHVHLHIGLTANVASDQAAGVPGTKKGWVSGEASNYRPEYWGVCNRTACGMGNKSDGTGVYTSMIHNVNSNSKANKANNWNDSPNPQGLGLAEISTCN